MNPQPLQTLSGGCLALLCLMLSACDTAPTQVDRHFGLAVRQAQTQQTHTPPPMGCVRAGQGAGCAMHPPRHPSPGTDGVSAQSAIERYQESFLTPPPPTPVFNLGVSAPRPR